MTGFRFTFGRRAGAFLSLMAPFAPLYFGRKTPRRACSVRTIPPHRCCRSAPRRTNRSRFENRSYGQVISGKRPRGVFLDGSQAQVSVASRQIHRERIRTCLHARRASDRTPLVSHDGEEFACGRRWLIFTSGCRGPIAGRRATAAGGPAPCVRSSGARRSPCRRASPGSRKTSRSGCWRIPARQCLRP